MIIPCTELDLETYHLSEAISNSKLKVFRRNPLLYKRAIVDRSLPQERRKCLDEGAGVDSFIFDGALEFAQRYACQPATYVSEMQNKPWNNNANVCKAWNSAREAEGKTVLGKDCLTRFARMREEVYKHPVAKALLSQGQPQVTFRHESKKDFPGLSLQARPDWFSREPIDVPGLITSNGNPYAVDLKKTAKFDEWWNPIDVGSPRMGKPVWDYDVDRQAALLGYVAYQDLERNLQSYTLVVEDEEPHRVAVFALSEDWLEAAWSDVRADLLRLNACRIANKWPGGPEGVVTLVPPQWLLDRAARTAGVTP